MLSHTVGVHGHAHDGRLEGNEDPRYLRQLHAFLPQSCEPGTCHAYQNVAYDAATDVIERVTGKTFEEALKELERIVGRLESGEAQLQEAIDLYERGDQLRRQCAARLDSAQARIEAIKTDADGRATGTAPFNAG